MVPFHWVGMKPLLTNSLSIQYSQRLCFVTVSSPTPSPSSVGHGDDDGDGDGVTDGVGEETVTVLVTVTVTTLNLCEYCRCYHLNFFKSTSLEKERRCLAWTRWSNLQSLKLFTHISEVEYGFCWVFFGLRAKAAKIRLTASSPYLMEVFIESFLKFLGDQLSRGWLSDGSNFFPIVWTFVRVLLEIVCYLTLRYSLFNFNCNMFPSLLNTKFVKLLSLVDFVLIVIHGFSPRCFITFSGWCSSSAAFMIL